MTIAYIAIIVISIALLAWARSSGKDSFLNALITLWVTLVGVFLGIQASLFVEHRKDELAYASRLETVVLNSPSLHLAADLSFYYEWAGGPKDSPSAKDIKRKRVDFDFSSSGRSALMQRFSSFNPKKSELNGVGEKFDRKFVMDSVRRYFRGIEDLTGSELMIRAGSREAYRHVSSLLGEFQQIHVRMLDTEFYADLAARENLRKLIVRTEAVLTCELLLVEGSLSRTNATNGMRVASLGQEQALEDISFAPCEAKVIERLRQIGQIDLLK